jgi:hypothetical protein
MPELLKACDLCGRAMNPNAVLYDAEARAICEPCFQMSDLVATDRRAADNIRKAGYLCAATGVACLFAPFALGFLTVCVIIALTSGIFAIQSLARGNERFTRHLTAAQQRVVWGCTIGGLLLAALSVMGLNLTRLVYGY